MSDPKKNAWEKADILLKPGGALLGAILVAWLGLQGKELLESKQRETTKAHLYAQLMSSREQSDSSLRQAMFKTIIDEFLASSANDDSFLPEGKSRVFDNLEREVLKLEVLAYNFHDALDLAPLFKDVHRRLAEESAGNGGVDTASRDALLTRLEIVAREVTDKQISALEEGGVVRRVSIDLEKFFADGIERGVVSQVLGAGDDGSAAKLVGKSFNVDVLNIDVARKEVLVRLTVWPLDGNGTSALVDLDFHVGYFDFPMIDNTRLGDGERCAIVLDDFADYSVDLALVYFPGSRASLKEKPFYDEIIEKTLHIGSSTRRQQWEESQFR